MKRKTRRKKEEFFRVLSDISTKVFTIGGVIIFGLGLLILTASGVPLKPHLMLIIYSGVGIIVALTLISVGLAYLHLKIHPSKIKYFKDVNFGKADNDTILKAVDGLLNFQKAEPFYVHVSPEFKEVSIILTKLEEAGFVTISGKPGEGKSMAAYQAAYKLSKRHRVYSLETTGLEDKTWDQIHDRLFDELDWGLKGRRKLILIDDAHKLQSRKDLKRDLQKEAGENNEEYIWIETEEEYEDIQPGEYIRLEFKDFVPNLLENFYEKPSLQEVFVNRINGLEDAKDKTNKGEIKDAWHFAFCATQGWERLVSKIEKLNVVELIVLFFISAHTVLSGGFKLHEKEVLEKIRGIGFGWLSEQKPQMSIPEAIQQLYELEKLIKIYSVNHDIGYIRSLHYNFAREIIKASIFSKQSYAKDMLTLAKALLTDKYSLCVYYGVFHRDIGAYAAGFDSENKDWLISFVNNLLPEKLQCYPSLLRGIKNIAKDIYDEIFRKLDVDRIAERVNTAEVGQFDQLANLLGAVGDHRDELIEKMDLAQLSKTADNAEVGQFDQLANLLGAVGDHRGELIEKLDLAQLSKTANSAEVGQFAQLVNLLGAVGDHRGELIEKMDLAQLSKTANSAEVGQFAQLARLLNAVEDRRDELIEKLDLAQLSKTADNAEVGQFDQLAHLLDTVEDRRDDLIENLNLVQLAKKCKDMKTTKQFEQLAHLLNALGDYKVELIGKLDFERLAQATNTTKTDDFRFHAMVRLLDTLDTRKKDLIALLDYDVLIERANQVDRYDIMWLTMFISQLDEERRNEFIRQIEWAPICMKCPILVVLLKALGTCLENLWKKAESMSEAVTFNKVAQHLRKHAKEIKQEIEKAAKTQQYSGVAKFLWNCNRIDHSLALEIAIDTMDKIVESFDARPDNYHDVGGFINALHVIDPALSVIFIKNNRVRERIQQSINEKERDWNEKVDDLKYLIKAFYRYVPKLCKKMVNDWIVVDLSSLDLDSIYKEVDGEKDIP